jgi:hypothetical protein
MKNMNLRIAALSAVERFKGLFLDMCKLSHKSVEGRSAREQLGFALPSGNCNKIKFASKRQNTAEKSGVGVNVTGFIRKVYRKSAAIEITVQKDLLRAGSN